ncbi:glycosyl hydrolase 5 family protein-like [Mercurialis annua]|uniref:glycosyl hydrolase 5 family protein-like n=1 Tax=Mercurialis annua TaxID=3986 RepID=UPI00215F46E3|nr:glycosyl hydrolase 5 family protein-like [Mercurialis annua]XP_050205746.1 glycosyl hydrolase 5 family protein-like [Mercurialis annua]
MKMLQAMLIIFTFCIFYTNSLPLSTNGRWIVDDTTQQRVKLACVNWPSHLEPMLAEGLDKKPLAYIVSQLRSSRTFFNCVRFTWATYMFTRFANLTVSESLDSMNLRDARDGVAWYNPWILGMTIVQAFEAVVNELGAQNIMVILDNQVSRPAWCCSDDDGNGFVGDVDFDAEEWLQGLSMVAELFKGRSQVIAISTRNEMRGPHQNVEDWYKYIKQAGSIIHNANPEVLIFASGLGYASDLTFLKNKSLDTNFNNKLVYEAHWYSLTWGWRSTWDSQNVSDVCNGNTQFFIHQTGFVIDGENPVPIFVGEIGLDQRGLSQTEEHYYSCVLGYLADFDIDWALRAWPGSYYYLNDSISQQIGIGVDDAMGVMDFSPESC